MLHMAAAWLGTDRSSATLWHLESFKSAGEAANIWWFQLAWESRGG